MMTHCDYDPLIDLIGKACLVLLGEPSRGTREFLSGAGRADITKRLIAEPGTTGDLPEIFSSGM